MKIDPHIRGFHRKSTICFLRTKWVWTFVMAMGDESSTWPSHRIPPLLLFGWWESARGGYVTTFLQVEVNLVTPWRIRHSGGTVNPLPIRLTDLQLPLRTCVRRNGTATSREGRGGSDNKAVMTSSAETRLTDSVALGQQLNISVVPHRKIRSSASTSGFTAKMKAWPRLAVGMEPHVTK